MNIVIRLLILSILVIGISFPKSNDHCFNLAKHSKNKYADGFSIYKSKKYVILDIKNKYDNDTYIVYKGAKVDLPKDCKRYTLIKAPLKKVVAFSTTHITALDLINELESLKGFSNLKYLTNDKVEKEKVIEVGFPPKVETIAKINPDLVFSYVTGMPEVDGMKKVKEIDKEIIYINEFKESSPLGRVEWIKVFGVLYNKEIYAKQKFDEIVLDYNELREKILKLKLKEVSVIVGFKQGGNWNAPALNSDLVKMIKDAGGKYILSNQKRERVSFEEVMLFWNKIDVWFPQNRWNKKRDFLKEDPFYNKLLEQKNIRIFNNNKIKNIFGWLDYYETALMRPDLLLKDLIKVIHPQVLEDKSLKWYRSIN